MADTKDHRMEPRLQHLMQQLDAIVWEREPASFQFSFVSQQAESILGYPLKQWREEPNFWIKRIYPQDLPLVQEFYRQCCHTEKPQEIEFRVITATSSILWLRDRVKVIKDEKGNVQMLSGLMVVIYPNKNQDIEIENSWNKPKNIDSVETRKDWLVIYNPLRNNSGEIIDFAREYFYSYSWLSQRINQEQMRHKKMFHWLNFLQNDGGFQEYCQVLETGIPLIKKIPIWQENQTGQMQTSIWEIRAAKLENNLVITGQDITLDQTNQQLKIPEENPSLEITPLLQQLDSKYKLLETLWQQIPVGIILAEAPSGRLVLMNEQVKQILGENIPPILASAEQIQQNQQFCYPDGTPYPPEELPLLRSLRSGEVIKDEEIEIRQANQQRRIMASSVPLRDSSKEIVASLFTFYEITDHKLSLGSWQLYSEMIKNLPLSISTAWRVAQKDKQILNRVARELELSLAASFRSEERFRLAQELSLDAFTVLRSIRNQAGEIIDFEWEYVNPMAAKVLKSTPEKLTGARLLEVLPGNKNSGLFDSYVRVVETGQSHDLEIPYYAEGITGWFRNMAVKLGDGIAISFSDISERKQAQEELYRREQEFRALVENSPDMIARLDRELRHLYVNPIATEITGIAAADFIGKTHLELGFSQEICNAWQENFRLVFASGKERLIEYDLPTYSGLRCFQCRIVPEFSRDGSVGSILCVTRDITDLKQTEQALRQSEARFRRVFESNMIGMGFWNSEGKIFANDAYFQILGYPPQQFSALGELNGKEIMPPAYLTLDEQAIQDALEKGVSTPYETEYIRQDGTRVPVLIGGALFEGTTDSGVFFVLDLSARKKAEAALRQSDAQYRQIVETSYEGIWTADANLITTFVNHRMTEMLGYKLTEMLGKSIFDFMDDTELSGAAAEISRQKQGVKMLRQLRWRRKDGSPVWTLNSSNPIFNQSGEFTGVIAMITDITHRVQAEAKLQETIQTLDSLIQACPLGITVFNLDDGVVQWWNPGAERIFGWSSQEVVGNFLPTVSPSQTEEFLRLVEALRQGEELTGVELLRRRKDGSLVDIAVWAARLVDSEGKMSCISIIADITDRKRLQAERERLLQREQAARAEAERANRVKDEFLAVLSHELRSPLNAILGWAQMLRSRKFNQAMTEKALETIERNAKLQTQLIEDLLDVSRILRGKTVLNVCPVNLASVIESALDTVRLSAIAKSIEIECFINAEVGLVSGDMSRLQQILWNLLSNAIKFTDRGGRVEVRLSRVTSKVEGDPLPTDHNWSPTSDYAQVQVRDTGMGIAAEFLPFVFDYFRQADSSSTRAHGGLGLGLAIVRHLAELHGGTVTAESPGLGYGATFTLRLPLMEAAVLPGSKAGWQYQTSLSPESGPLSGLRLLVVDDDADSRDFMAAVLEDSGAMVTVAASVAAALVVLSRFRPDVLVSDIGMPEEDGYTLIRRVRDWERNSGVSVPSVAVTAYATDEDRMRAFEAGFGEHLSKPVEPDALIKAVLRLSGRECG